jgi:hypothetical protein
MSLSVGPGTSRIFVFWVGIGHAGTLISAILFLFRQKWRTSINRAAEAMTIFAVMCALIFPGIHVGRVWVAYFMFPIPNQMGMWPNFRSPLLWDVFAVSIYGTVSALFWYVGLIPDLATMRDRAKTGLKKKIYGLFAIGWRGSNRHWQNYEVAYLILAGLATPARPVRALDRIHGLRGVADPRLAHDDLPAVLRGGRDLLRIRDGDHADGDLPERLQDDEIITIRHFDYMARSSGHRVDGRLRVRDGVLHRVVQRQPVRDVHVQEPRVRARTRGRTGR